MHDFETWIKAQKDKGLKDLKLVIDGDTSNVSVSKAKAEIVRLHTLAELGFTEDFPKAPDYSAELTDLNNALNA